MSFLSLPSELRVQMYTLVLVQDEPLEFIAASCPAVRTLELRSRDYLFLPSNPVTPEMLRAIDAVCMPSLERIVITSDENGPWSDEAARLKERMPGPR
jgi:hypothetical protein